ncbi:hypothetical protein JCM16303_002953 [Sporobolomyces ruberrimus]
MTGRVRKPTARALDAAQSRLLESAAAADRKRPAPPPQSANSAAVKRKGRAVNAKGRKAVAQDQARASAQATEEAEESEEQQQDEEDEDDQPDLTLYCVCLGYDTGEQPMIQCEHCTNWFHFGCIGISEEIAGQIEGYACEMCQQMDAGTTRMLAGATVPPPSASTSNLVGASAVTHSEGQDLDNESQRNEEGEDEDEDSGIDDDNDDDPMADEDDGDYGVTGAARKRRRGKQADARASRAARRRKVEAEGGNDSESYDEEDDEEEKPKKAAKKKVITNRRTSATPVRPSETPSGSKASSVPQTEKTRAAVVKQFTATFSSIYSASSAAHAEDVSHRASSFAKAVEEELFSGFCELDDKGVRSPRTKYASKFRSLQFNLKTNAVFRSRIAHDEYEAAGIVNVSAEDLQTPELKAMAESVRAASLKNSVKEAMVAPTAKRTHKGEEEMENNSARLLAEEEAALREAERKRALDQKQRERSNSISQAESPFPDESRSGGGGAFAESSAPGTPDMSGDPTSDPFSRARPRPSLTGSSSYNFSTYSHDLSEAGRSPSIKQGSPFAADSPFAAAQEARSRSPVEEGGDMSPPPQPRHRNSSTSIDMSAIWGKAKAASPSLEPKDEDAAMGDTAGENQFESDMFNFDASKNDDDDDFEKDLFRSEGASPVKKTTAELAPQVPAISDLPPVWAGDLIVTEEGGFPSFGVQVGGRPVGTDPKTWQKLLPRGLNTAGRISTHQASKYLVDCSFAPTRELNVVALLPDTTGPSEHFPHKLEADRCLAKHAHIVDYYIQKDRIGVIKAPKELSALVKDIYIIPLAKEQPLPEYIELLDEHVIPETGKREQNFLLCVLVLQKGALPTVRTAPLARSPAPTSAPSNPEPSSSSSTPAPASSAPPTTAPSSGPASEPLDPTAFQSLLSGVDSSTLQHLLSNPDTLSALTTNQSQAVLNVANSQQSLPLSVPTGPRSGPPTSSSSKGPPIHPSRLAQLPIDPSSYSSSQSIPPPPTGPSRTDSSSGVGSNFVGSSGNFNSQSSHFENNLTGQGEYDGDHLGMGDGGWVNNPHYHPQHQQQRGGYRGGGGGGGQGNFGGRGGGGARGRDNGYGSPRGRGRY